jgi:uncharacterized protein
MKIYLNKITENDMDLHFDQTEGWVAAAVERVDEKIDDIAARPKSARPIDVDFNLRMVDEVVVLNGQVETHILLLCSRCAAPFHFKAHPNFSALFCKDPVMAGVGHLESTGKGHGKPAGQNKGHARHAHDESHDTSGSQDLDITYLSEDFIALGDVLTEQLQLQVPFQPLCKESCKGMCSQCGADLNQGRCACAKLAKNGAFSVLQNLKL